MTLPYTLILWAISLIVKNRSLATVASVLFALSIIGFIYSLIILVISTLFIKY
jgi:hypothetical protein